MELPDKNYLEQTSPSLKKKQSSGVEQQISQIYQQSITLQAIQNDQIFLKNNNNVNIFFEKQPEIPHKLLFTLQVSNSLQAKDLIIMIINVINEYLLEKQYLFCLSNVIIYYKLKPATKHGTYKSYAQALDLYDSVLSFNYLLFECDNKNAIKECKPIMKRDVIVQSGLSNIETLESLSLIKSQNNSNNSSQTQRKEALIKFDMIPINQNNEKLKTQKNKKSFFWNFCSTDQ